MPPLTTTEFYTVIYIVAGLVFLAAAVYLQATRTLAIGNTTDKDALAIQYKDFKLQTFYPVVALFVIAFACTVVFPIVLLILQSRAASKTISVTVPVSPRNVSISTEPRTQSDDAQMLVYESDEPIRYVLQGDKQHGSVTVSFSLQSTTGDIDASITSQYPHKRLTVRLNGPHAAVISEQIVLPTVPPTTSSALSPSNQLSAR